MYLMLILAPMESAYLMLVVTFGLILPRVRVIADFVRQPWHSFRIIPTYAATIPRHHGRTDDLPWQMTIPRSA